MEDAERYGKPMTAEQHYRQNILMYVRDKIISPIMPPVKIYEKELDIWLKSQDYVLIDKLAAKHTDELIRLFSSRKKKAKS